MIGENVTTIELSLPSKLGYEKVARHMLAWLAPRVGFDSARIADIQTAVSEVCINAIEHGNQNKDDRRVHVAFSYGQDHLDAVVADEGLTPYAPSGPAATIEQKLAGLAPERGMGLMLISALVDESGFLPNDTAQGNRYWLRVYRDPQTRTTEAARPRAFAVAAG